LNNLSSEKTKKFKRIETKEQQKRLSAFFFELMSN